MTKRTLDLGPRGNCQTSALIDREARMIWACLPRVDGDPIFSALLTDKDYADPETRGFWSIDLEDAVSVTQDYIRNTPVLRTLKKDYQGGIVEILDFCPRFKQQGRIYRPVAFARIVRPLAGSPRIRVRLRPASAWDSLQPDLQFGSNHIRIPLATMPMRLSTDAPIVFIAQEIAFRL